RERDRGVASSLHDASLLLCLRLRDVRPGRAAGATIAPGRRRVVSGRVAFFWEIYCRDAGIGGCRGARRGGIDIERDATS
ncbi:MAG TPA: hypothetical protein VJ696_06795, partial [Rhodanobacteraceae bacterium]|nr:hypothetical protein [Rhodanobacteraceae bacterium]